MGPGQYGKWGNHGQGHGRMLQHCTVPLSIKEDLNHSLILSTPGLVFEFKLANNFHIRDPTYNWFSRQLARINCVPQAQFTDHWMSGLTILLFYPRNFGTNCSISRQICCSRVWSVNNFDIKGLSVSTQKVWCCFKFGWTHLSFPTS